MRLGVYRPENRADPDTETIYYRTGLYDFEHESWSEDTSGSVVKRVSENPTPHELKAKLQVENKGRSRIVCTPERLEDQDATVEVIEPSISLEEGKQWREEHDGPLTTTLEARYEKQQGVRVYPDAYDIGDEERAFAEQEGFEIVRESEWDGLDFEEEFDFDFYTTETENPA